MELWPQRETSVSNGSPVFTLLSEEPEDKHHDRGSTLIAAAERQGGAGNSCQKELYCFGGRVFSWGRNWNFPTDERDPHCGLSRGSVTQLPLQVKNKVELRRAAGGPRAQNEILSRRLEPSNNV